MKRFKVRVMIGSTVTETILEARSESDAKKVARAQYPSARNITVTVAR